jgi:hypothetical protein
MRRKTMGSVKKWRRKKMSKHKHRKFLKQTRGQRLAGKKVLRSKKKKAKKKKVNPYKI